MLLKTGVFSTVSGTHQPNEFDHLAGTIHCFSSSCQISIFSASTKIPSILTALLEYGELPIALPLFVRLFAKQPIFGI